jgi:hypothetical protein
LVTDLASEAGWPAAIAAASGANHVAPEDASLLLALTRDRHADADMAALVESAGRPGLKDRMVRYREAEANDRAAAQSAPRPTDRRG